MENILDSPATRYASQSYDPTCVGKETNSKCVSSTAPNASLYDKEYSFRPPLEKARASKGASSRRVISSRRSRFADRFSANAMSSNCRAFDDAPQRRGAAIRPPEGRGDSQTCPSLATMSLQANRRDGQIEFDFEFGTMLS